jgi:hypothetical protein
MLFRKLSQTLAVRAQHIDMAQLFGCRMVARISYSVVEFLARCWIPGFDASRFYQESGPTAFRDTFRASEWQHLRAIAAAWLLFGPQLLRFPCLKNIIQMPIGYDTLVREIGSTFPGRQKRMVPLARVLYHKIVIRLM